MVVHRSTKSRNVQETHFLLEKWVSSDPPGQFANFADYGLQ